MTRCTTLGISRISGLPGEALDKELPTDTTQTGNSEFVADYVT
jgi:hypothetical protein